MLFFRFLARATQPRYQEHRNRFSSYKVTAVVSWMDFGKSGEIPGSHAPKSSILMNLCECLYTGSPKSELFEKNSTFFFD